MLEGRDNEAISSFQTALKLGPETDLIWLNLGIAWARSGHPDAARDAFQRAVELTEKKLARDPRDGTAQARAAYLYARLGQNDRARFQIGEALRLSPNERDTRAWAIETYEVLGSHDLAFEILNGSPVNMVRGILVELTRFPGMADFNGDSRFVKMLASYHVQ
jgi:Flp pilus assembly protein TadD